MRNRLAVCLACAVLLLPRIAAADGFIIIDNPPTVVPGHYAFAPLQVSYHHVTVSVNDLVAVTTVDEEFYNPNSERLEGTYLFPLPDGATVDTFSMEVGAKIASAELLPADKARAIYEDIVRRMKDPALLEYAGRGAFRLRVYPIEPRSGKRIRLSYTQLLAGNAGIVEYRYPLATEKFSSAPVKDVSVTVTLDGAQPLKSVYCPTHPAEIHRDGDHRAVVGWEDRDAWPDSDFSVIWSRTPDPLGIELVPVPPADGEDGYFLLLASPGLGPETRVESKDITFVLDTSGSMAGPKLDQAKKALLFCLANLDGKDRFEIIRFSTETEPLFGALVPADDSHLGRARAFVQDLRPIGGTAIQDALGQAMRLRPAAADTGRPYFVMFLTDGIPTIGETGEDPLVDSVKAAGRATRLFTFGIGTDVNTHLLDRLASATRGASQYVLPREDIEVKVSSFYSKIRSPVLSNVSVAFTNPSLRVYGLLPSEMPDLFRGDMIVALGRYSGSGPGAVTISGTVNGTPRRFAADVVFPAAHTGEAASAVCAFVPRLWATRRVGRLLDEIRLRGESAELRDEVIRLARQFGIITPYTAYLVLEDEARRGVAENLRSFQEMEVDRDAVSGVRQRMDSVRNEAASESARAGAQAVENSLALQGLMNATTLAPAAPAAGMDKRTADAAGQGYRASQARNYAQQVKMVAGRAFYLNGSIWTDSTAQLQTGLRQHQVRVGSSEYFTLARRSSQVAQWLALGTNVDLVLDGELLSVRE